MRFLWILLAVFCLTAYLLLDSGALEFRPKTVEKDEMVERTVSVPEFHPDRLAGYFEKLVSKAGK